MRIIDDLILNHQKGTEIFRGQPEAGRPLFAKALRHTRGNRKGYYLKALEKFRLECWAFGWKPTGDIDDVAVAQHYGLATYLLDWTTNPLVALFFASRGGVDENGEVFLLTNPKSIPAELQKNDQWKNIKGPLLYNPPLIDARIARQKGLFTIQGREDGEIKADKIYTVPRRLKKFVNEILYSMGIDESTLFPDLQGLCGKINWETRNSFDRMSLPISGRRIISPKAHGFVTISGTATPSLVPSEGEIPQIDPDAA